MEYQTDLRINEEFYNFIEELEQQLFEIQRNKKETIL